MSLDCIIAAEDMNKYSKSILLINNLTAFIGHRANVNFHPTHSHARAHHMQEGNCQNFFLLHFRSRVLCVQRKNSSDFHSIKT